MTLDILKPGLGVPMGNLPLRRTSVREGNEMAIQRPTGSPPDQGWLDGQNSERFHTAAVPTLDSTSTALGDASILLSMESQLVSLYAERSQLHQALGVSDADDLIELVARLRAGDSAVVLPFEATAASLEELEARIAELDRWAGELAAKAVELDAREEELSRPDPLALAELDQTRRSLVEHGEALERRDADLFAREAEAQRRSAEIEASGAELQDRERAVAALEEQAREHESRSAHLAHEHQSLIAELARRHEILDAREADLAREHESRAAELAQDHESRAAGLAQDHESRAAELAQDHESRAAALTRENESLIAELARRTEMLDAREAELDDQLQSLASRFGAADERHLDVTRRDEEVSARLAEFERRQADLDRAAEFHEARTSLVEARDRAVAEREQAVSEREAAVRASATGDEQHRLALRSVVEQGPLFDKVRHMEIRLLGVYETIDHLTNLLESDQ
jgi:DNA repair exonuclease SbcCD ATPase subunit